MKLAVSEDMLGRVFNGSGNPIDKGPKVWAEEYLDINGMLSSPNPSFFIAHVAGYPINPFSRIYPEEMIQTGISTIDTMVSPASIGMIPCSPCRTPLLEVKRSLYSVPLVSPITRLPPRFVDRPVLSSDQDPARVSTMDMRTISLSSLLPWVSTWRLPDSSSRTLRRVVLFPTLLSLSIWPLTQRKQPTVLRRVLTLTGYRIERIITPRLALTTAEYFAYQLEKHVLVVMTDMSR